MFTFPNPVITAGHEASYLQYSAPLHAAHPNPVLRHWPGADWKGSRALLDPSPCFLRTSVLFPFKFRCDPEMLNFSDLMGLPHEMKQICAKLDWKEKQNNEPTLTSYWRKPLRKSEEAPMHHWKV